MIAKERSLRLATALLGLAPLFAGSAAAGYAPIAVVRPGGGLLVADGRSIVPLVVLTQGEERALRSLRVTSTGGRLFGSERVGPHSARFFMAMPEREALLELNIDLEFEDGTRRTEVYPLVLSPAEPPALELSAAPPVLSAAEPAEVEVLVSAAGEGLLRPIVVSRPGAVRVMGSTEKASSTLRGRLALPPDLPSDAPSHVQLLAAAASLTGYAVRTLGLSVVAPVRIEARVPRGHRLLVEGAEAPVPPASRAPSGIATLDGVPLRYGAAVRVFQVRGRRRQELSIPLPAGRVPLGVASALPDQAFADGGTGPTIAVAVPPDPFGGQPTWPTIDVEGAKLVGVLEDGPAIRVLVLERPAEAGEVRLLLDGLPAAKIPLPAGRGFDVRLTPEPSAPGERGAAIVTVLDAYGRPTDGARPRARLASGPSLEPVRLEPGRYRVALPVDVPGGAGELREVVAELEPLPVVLGDPLEPPRASLPVALEGAPPELRAEALGSEQAGAASAAAVPIALWASAFGGATVSELLRGGVGAGAEARLPVLDGRLGARIGVELAYGRSEGEVTLEGGPSPSVTEVTGLILPLELVLAAMAGDRFDLLVRLGAAVRLESGALSVEGERVGGTERLAGSLRAGLEGQLAVGPGRIAFGALADGLLATADGLSDDRAALSGSLFGVRAEVGYRTWLFR